MNGIARRLLGGGLGSSSKDAPQPQPEQQPAVAPLALGGAKPPSGSWSTPQAMLASARSMTGRSDDAPPPTGPVDDSTIRQRPARTTSIKGAASVVTSPTAMSPPPSTTTPPLALRAPTNGSIRPVVNTKTFKAPPVQPITKDELLMSLLASEAVVDSRDSEILNAEQVEELKKEDALLQSRYASSTKKLALETKMRDAARSLATLNAQNKSMAKQTQEQLDIASSRFETALADHTRVRDRAVEVQRKLLEHRAGVLSAALRRVEDEQSDGHLSVPSSRMMSPTTATSVTSVSTVSKFDGAHFFAGHADAALPANLRSPLSAADVQALQERVRTAESSANVAAKKAAELGRDLGLLQLEKAEAETTAALEIQQAEEQIAQLRREERAELQEDISQRDKQIEDLQSRIEDLESDANRREPGASGNDEELEAARKALRAIVRSQRITVNTNTTEAGSERQSTDPSSVYSVANMIAAIASHVESLDEGKKSLEKARREVELQLREEQASKENLEQSDRIVELSRSESSGVASVEQRSAELQQLMSVLNALWTILPSPEARASKLTSPPSNPMSPRTTAGPPRTPRTPGPPLISEADIRSLRTLYDPNGPFLSPAPPGKFNIDSFATKVRGLIADDRAIIDRLLKFASTHDLLKTNAEKAQKLAQEYCQPKDSRQAALLEEIEQLQAAYDEVMEIRAQLEVDAAGQAEVCAHLTEANATLSARALTLAEESANASAPVAAARAKLEAEAVELRKKSAKLEQELERVRNAEQNQRIALLDELNSMQTENTNLRNQIRGLQQR
ncbi:Up-regulated during septation protein [Ceratobasidium sp. AG-Ba]|nr:Up-regulated during septation protein [Ceratobasidium sp. AG-Ba]